MGLCGQAMNGAVADLACVEPRLRGPKSRFLMVCVALANNQVAFSSSLST